MYITIKQPANEIGFYILNMLAISTLRTRAVTPPTYYDLPASMKSFLQGGSFKVGTFFSLLDEYPEPGLESFLVSGIPINDPRHELVGDAMKQLQIDNYYRHYKSHGFKRFPNCVDVNSIGIDPFYNNYYYIPAFGCSELGTTMTPYYQETQPWGKRIVKDADDLGLNIGFYHKAMVDFFYQMDYQTGDLNYGTNAVSPAVSRTWQVENPDEIIPVGNIVLNGSAVPDPTAAEDNDFATSNPQDEPQKSVYYLCVNNIKWRNTLKNRLFVKARQGAKNIVFDVNHMPKEGCFCSNCRIKYQGNGPATLAQNFDPDLANTDPENYFLGGGLFKEVDPVTQEVNWTYTNAARRLNADLMSTSLVDHFTVLQPEMNFYGSTAVVSTGEFPSMINDAHRSEFVRAVNVPKGEWTMPLKKVNNRPFYGATDALNAFRIPEHIRLMGSIAMYRDASQHRLAHVWMPTLGFYRPSNAVAHNLTSSQITNRNNQMLRTWIGAGVVLGVINNTTFQETFFKDMDPSSAVTIKYNKDQICHFDPNATLIGDGLCPNTSSGDVNIILLAKEHYALTAGKRPYMHSAVYFSETLKNDNLYGNNDLSFGSVLYDRRAFQKSIMPALLAYQSRVEAPIMVNGPTQPGPPPFFGQVVMGSRIYPVGFVFDNAPIPTTVKVLLVPEAGNLSLLQNPTGIPTVNILSHNQNNTPTDYYRIGEDEQLNTLLKAINSVTIQAEMQPPPFYIESFDPPRGKRPVLHASFFTPTDYSVDMPENPLTYSALTVPLVIDPVWGIIKGKWTSLALTVLNNSLNFTVVGKMGQVESDHEFSIPLGTNTGSFILPPVTSFRYDIEGFTISWSVAIEGGATVRYIRIEGQQYPIRIVDDGQGELHFLIPGLDPATANAYDYSAPKNSNSQLIIETSWLPNIQSVQFYDDNPNSPSVPIPFTIVNGRYIIQIPPFFIVLLLT